MATVSLLAMPAIDFLVPLVISVALFTVVVKKEKRTWDFICLAAMGLLCAVATLIKFDMAIILGAVVLISFIAFKANKKSLVYGACLFISYIIFFLISWALIGQPLTGLVDYVTYGLDISSGYTAMAVQGFSYQTMAICLFLLSAVSLLTIFAYSIKKRADIAIFLLISAPLLFSAYKYGFVRNDQHVLLFLQIFGLMFGLLLVALTTGPKKDTSSSIGKLYVPLSLLCLVMMTALIVPNVYYTLKSDSLFTSPGAYGQAFSALVDGSSFNNLVSAQKNNIMDSSPLDAGTLGYIGNRTVDIFPWDISVCWAYGLNWSPRPMFQSYNAYTSKLDTLNSGHFTLESGPGVVLYADKSVDGRYPPFDEPSTFRALLNNYTYYGSTGQFIMLNKTNFAPNYGQVVDLGNEQAGMGQFIEVPQFDGAVFGRIYVNYSIYGMAMDLLYKPSNLYIQFRLTNGSYTQKYRFIPAQAVDGVFLSKYIQNNDDIASVFQGNTSGDIAAIAITADAPADYSKYVKAEFFGEKAKS
jgi:hypothetical protein